MLIYHIAITELSQIFNNLINSVLSFIFLLFHQIHYKLRAYRITTVYLVLRSMYFIRIIYFFLQVMFIHMLHVLFIYEEVFLLFLNNENV